MEKSRLRSEKPDRSRVRAFDFGGRYGIRTHGDPEATTTFEAVPFVRSGNLPLTRLAVGGFCPAWLVGDQVELGARDGQEDSARQQCKDHTADDGGLDHLPDHKLGYQESHHHQRNGVSGEVFFDPVEHRGSG